MEQSAKDELEADGWLLGRGEPDARLDPFPPGIDAVIIAKQYVLLTVEDWLWQETEDPHEMSPVDGDIDQ
ncbi:hypothetical protein N7508_005908 [Penicillium antarcticum]|uniref:uncharacterized protein n=1 Tax=Penicillium antarcticum TaxID=416450 RepID=UPI0023A57924|nr:uncharacterized protein N7508_005908 [Penicillium antarcticum]KAJ5306893.1 hypothetical protein N7508_005908 [Penicillium antarcticum]